MAEDVQPYCNKIHAKSVVLYVEWILIERVVHGNDEYPS